jgi:hypothetical protein
MVIHPVMYEVVQSQRHIREELCSRGNNIRVKRLPINKILNLLTIYPLLHELLPEPMLPLLINQTLPGRPEPPGPLLVHLSPGSHPINGQVEEPLGPHNLHELVDILEDVLALLVEVGGEADVVVALGVAAWVDQPVHVDVEVVDRWVGARAVQICRL